MMAGLAPWWRLRTPREQRLLAVMLVLLAIVVGWLLVVRPLADALDAAQRRHADAATALAEARARSEAGRRRPDVRQAPPRPLDGFVSRTATESGFAGARIAAQGPARASIAIDAARPQAFFAWIRTMEEQGLSIEALTARANQDRTLAVEATLSARVG